MKKLTWTSEIFDANKHVDSEYSSDTFYCEHFYSHDEKTTLTLESYIRNENEQVVIVAVIRHVEGGMITVRENVHNLSETLTESILRLYNILCEKHSVFEKLKLAVEEMIVNE